MAEPASIKGWADDLGLSTHGTKAELATKIARKLMQPVTLRQSALTMLHGLSSGFVDLTISQSHPVGK